MFVYRVVWSVLPYDLHNYPISIIQYNCDFVSGPVSYRVFILFVQLRDWAGGMIFPQSILVYIHVRFFFQFFLPFLRDQSVILWFLTVIIVIISLLMGRGDIVRNIWLSYPFPTLPFNLPYTTFNLTPKPPGIPVLPRPSPFPNNRGFGSSKFLNFTHWSFSDYDLFQIKQGGVWWGAPAQVAGRRGRRSIDFRPAPTRPPHLRNRGSTAR